MPSVMAVAPKKRIKQMNSATSRIKKLIPSLAVGGVDAAAEDVEHQRSNYITGQG